MVVYRKWRQPQAVHRLNREGMSNSGVRRKMADAVRSARAKRRMSQQEVAKQAGVSASRIVEIENEQSDPRLSTLDRVFTAVGLSIEVTEAA